ncbi:DUF3017 domain-containing protein [Kineococcus glutinatus]|uniref:DUF3017 family protein n=1 Tax=Kineococcus glutinatus TaxID=1070872 RepID=A0ABP9HPU3_9ACTN
MGAQQPAGGDGAPPPAGEPARAVHEVPPRRDAVMLALLAGVVLALVLAVLADHRAGGLVLGADLAVAAVVRLVLPVAVVGSLAVRSRAVDVAVLVVLAVACTGLAWVTPTGPPAPPTP